MINLLNRLSKLVHGQLVNGLNEVIESKHGILEIEEGNLVILNNNLGQNLDDTVTDGLAVESLRPGETVHLDGADGGFDVSRVGLGVKGLDLVDADSSIDSLLLLLLGRSSDGGRLQK